MGKVVEADVGGRSHGLWDAAGFWVLGCYKAKT